MSFAQTPLLPGVSRRGALAQRRWLQRAALVSVLLHLVLAASLVYRAPPTAPEAPAPSLPSVELVFDEAAPRAAPTPGAPPLPSPVPSPAELPAPPPAPEAPSPPAPASSPPPAPPAPNVATAPPAPPAPPPPASPPAPNATAAPAAPPRPAPPPAVAAPTPRDAPPVMAEPLPLPGPPPPSAPPEPQPRLAAPAPPRPATPPRTDPTPPEAPRPAVRPQPTAPAFAGTRFIPDATLGPLRPPQAAPAPRRTAPEQLAHGPNARPDRPNAAPATRADENVAGATLRITGANLGADWRAAFMEWLRRNGRYPREAAMNGEDGTTIVRFEVDRQGRVQSVRLTSRSGSQWLDIASTALLRDRTIPPFPPGTESNSATIDLTINYILIRR